MKLFKFLFVVMSLLSAIPCFGRRVHLDGNWKHSKKCSEQRENSLTVLLKKLVEN